MISKSVGAHGINQKADVRAIQCLLNLPENMRRSRRESKVAPSGRADAATIDAIERFQKEALKMPKPDGRVDARGGTLRALEAALGPVPGDAWEDPPWLRIACEEERRGVREVPGRGEARDNPRILEYLQTAPGLSKIDDSYKTSAGVVVNSGYKMNAVDETAWCACFVKWCLTRAGYEPSAQYQASARAYIDYGVPSERRGAVSVLYREPFGDSASGYHVGFFVGGSPKDGYVALLGGNQNNRVCRKWYVGFQKIWRGWP